MDFVKGSLAFSKAGRDRGEALAVLGEENGRILVANGKDRPLERPKKTNPAHLSRTKTILPDEAFRSNRALKRALKECVITGNEVEQHVETGYDRS